MAKFNFKNSVEEAKEPLSTSLSEKATMVEQKKNFDFRFVNLKDIIPNPYNESVYEVDNITSLAENIKEFGLNQNLEVLEVEIEGEKKYRVIGGHRRLEALKLLVSEVGADFSKVPCKVQRGFEEVEEQIRVIKGNCDNRELSSKEKRLQTEELRRLISLKKGEGATKKEINREVAEITGEDVKTIERRNNINERLIPPLKEYFDNNKITFNQAYKFAVLDEQMQLALLDLLQENNSVSNEQLLAIKESNKKLLEEKKEIAKNLEEKQKEVTLLEKEKESLKEELEVTSVEQEVTEEEKKKLEKKIREEVAKMTEEEMVKLKQNLEDITVKAEKLEEAKSDLLAKLEEKNKAHEKAVSEVESPEQPEKVIDIEKEVAKVRIKESVGTIVKTTIETCDKIKKGSFKEESQMLIIELEKTLEVVIRKIGKLVE